MKKFLPLVFSLICVSLYAQEESIFSHYTINPVLVNPAAAGFDEDYHNVFLNLRSSWAGFPGAPNTYSVNYNGPVGNNLGIGALLYSENIASLTRYRAQLSYAIRFDAGDYKFGAGLSTELHRIRLDNSAIGANPDIFDQNDILINDLVDGETQFDASIGAYGEFKDQVYFGLSFPNLVRSRLENIAGFNPTFNFIANVGARFDFPQNKIKINPSILVRQSLNAPLLTDLNLLASFLSEQLIAGLNYRLGNEGVMGLSIGTKYNAIRFLYSYEVNFGEFQSYSTGAHEISINFAIERKQDPSKKSNRF